MSDDRTLSLSTVTATVHAPIEKVNIADWLLHLPMQSISAARKRILQPEVQPLKTDVRCRSMSRPSATRW